MLTLFIAMGRLHYDPINVTTIHKVPQYPRLKAQTSNYLFVVFLKPKLSYFLYQLVKSVNSLGAICIQFMSIGIVTSFPELQSPNTPVTVKHRKCGICCSGVLHTSVLPCVPGQMSKFLGPFGNSLHSDENNQSAPVYSALISKANQLSKSAVKTYSLYNISQ